MLGSFPPATPNTDLVVPVTERRRGHFGPDPARDGRARRARQRRGEAPGGGAGPARPSYASAHPPARLVGRLRRDRRRPAPRSRRRARLPLERRLHDVAARSARPAYGGRPARGRRDRPADDRRPPARLLGRHDELRARAGAGALRRGAGDGARRRRLVDARVRGDRAQLAVRRARARRSRRRSCSSTTASTRRRRSKRSSRRTATASPRRRSSRSRSCGPSTTTATLTAPDGSIAWQEAGLRRAGNVRRGLSRRRRPLRPKAASAAADHAAPACGGTLDADCHGARRPGPDLDARPGASRSTRRSARCASHPARVVVRPTGGRADIRWAQARAARVKVTIETAEGRRRPNGHEHVRCSQASRRSTWDGRGANRKPVGTGRYVARVTATNELGAVSLTQLAHRSPGRALARRTA